MGTVRVINLTPYDKQSVPEVNKEYHTFDDGKISPSRHAIAKVLEVIPFEIAEPRLIEAWKMSVEECYWLYDKETYYFIKTELEEEEDPSYFVRTTDGGWFSIGWWGARLDVTGKLYDGMLKWLEENK
jgi:hypothetical protein